MHTSARRAHRVETGLVAELVVAGRQAEALVHSGMHHLVRPGTWTRGQTAAAALWLVGILGDAWTTLAMMATGRFEEAGGVAAAGMALVGPGVYTAWASLVCLGLMTVNLGRPTARYASVIVAVLTVLAVMKAGTAGANALLWMTS